MRPYIWEFLSQDCKLALIIIMIIFKHLVIFIQPPHHQPVLVLLRHHLPFLNEFIVKISRQVLTILLISKHVLMFTWIVNLSEKVGGTTVKIGSQWRFSVWVIDEMIIEVINDHWCRQSFTSISILGQSALQGAHIPLKMPFCQEEVMRKTSHDWGGQAAEARRRLLLFFIFWVLHKPARSGEYDMLNIPPV